MAKKIKNTKDKISKDETLEETEVEAKIEEVDDEGMVKNKKPVYYLRKMTFGVAPYGSGQNSRLDHSVPFTRSRTHAS